MQISTDAGLGSGIIFDAAGDIVTNAHVVGKATTFTVRLATTGASLQADLVGAYPPDDLAVIKVRQAGGLRPATFADSSGLQVGDIVLAMGSPLGLSSSVTDGIVSAVGRTVSEPSEAGSPGATLPDVVQTSAAINPGNSGGALVDIDGQVIGVPTLAATDAQLGGGAAPGIGFAIPSNIVKDIAGQLSSQGRVTNSHRAALGVNVRSLTTGSGAPAGVAVVAVTPGGPADSAGIAAGDVITSLAGTDTPTAAALSTVLAGKDVGSRVPVQVKHGGGTTGTVSVTLGQLPGS